MTGRSVRWYRDRLSELKGERSGIEKRVKQEQGKIKALRQELRASEKAQALVQVAAQKTQEQLRYQLSELPKLALSSVFDDPYDFEVDIEIKRNKTEIHFYFVREGVRINPKDNSGLGAVDIAGMSLRPALWSMRSPQNRPCIFLDEPFKHLKGQEANSRALKILQKICQPRPEKNWPGLQIIMVADERSSREEIAELSDRLFLFKMRGRRTVVQTIKK